MRQFNHDILDLIKNRWSSRAFSSEPVEYEDVLAVLEAARYAPSCFNEQPWEFLVAYEKEELEIVRGALNEKNSLWAVKAPVLIVATARPVFHENGKNNRWAAFDTGTAWGFLALEATRRGLLAHAIGGFSAKKLQDALRLPDDTLLLVIIALGKMGDKAELQEQFLKVEAPGLRKEMEAVARRIKNMAKE